MNENFSRIIASNTLTILNAAGLILKNKNFDCWEIPKFILSDNINNGSILSILIYTRVI